MLEVEHRRGLFQAELEGLVVVADLHQRDAHTVAVVVQLLHLAAKIGSILDKKDGVNKGT